MQIKTDNHQGTILRIQRMSTEDGPGIRSTVFFKGCPLACIWCHNPESIARERQLFWTKIKCLGCLSCIDACPQNMLQMTGAGMAIDSSKCDTCGACVSACPSTAMDIYGECRDAQSLAAELLKDRVYFEKSGGGVTLSGGEPILQAKFCQELLEILKASGVHTALDTCGQGAWQTLEMLLPYTDLLMFDLKEMATGKHKKFTGAGNKIILENILRLARHAEKQQPSFLLWIRTPLIPGCTATKSNVKKIGAFIAENLGAAVARWELCTFNNLCLHKYEGLGLDWKFKNVPLLSAQEAQLLADTARRSGADPDIVYLSGPLKFAEEQESKEDKHKKSAAATAGK